ncbi:MAG: lactoylglutathione lyase [Clostridiaceae bacterium]|jgi:lactoylglutathione lyase|nr:lactoylglutathione lyase [Clostridiaceae bacterium]
MNFRIDHYNINVKDLEKSIEFYQNALGLKEVKRKNAGDGSFIIVFLGDDSTTQKIELTWLRDKEGKYELGDNESHIAFKVDDFDAAYKLHKEMGCICYENKSMGIYFIEDPDGYWLEIIPSKR